MDQSEREVLEEIRTDVKENKVHAARTDERTKHIQDEIRGLKQNRIAPLEEKVEQNEKRSQRNSIILGGVASLVTAATTKIMGWLHI